MIEAILTGLIILSSLQGLEAPPPEPLANLEGIETTVVPTPPPPLELPAIALAIASCESGDGRGSYSLTAENPVSSASGKYQFIDSTWRAVTGLEPPASAYDERTQDEAFLRLFNNGAGAFHWNASRSCWG